ncbi:hypothetical protein ACERK3_07480 [Phycisphaerales bacterium AB-hyl4]|uniref:Secreted protein n=1 Tax=Natronomicrosphaera hydrolytica TaxID=3242702 RepID=A0ABV4U3H5_9BACT
MPTRLLSLVVAFALAAWTPMWCCCLTSQAAAHESASHCGGEGSANHGSCHGQASTEPVSDSREAPEPCQCPDVVKQRLLEADGQAWLLGGGATLPTSLTPTFNAWATACLPPVTEISSLHTRTTCLPYSDCAPSLHSMQVLLTI